MGLLIFLAALTIIVLAFSLYCYKTTFHVPKIRHEDLFRLPQGEQYDKVAQRMLEISLIMNEAQCQWVTTTAKDGTKLWGRFYEYNPGAPVLLLFHGYRSMALRDSAGGFALGQKLGFNVLAVDQRCHGRSDGRVITFGIRERLDCLEWVNYINRRYERHVPIVLSGISMGAATVLMASELELPENVTCIMADCPYSSPAGIIMKVAGDRGYPKKLSYPVIWLAGLLYGGFQVTECTAAEAVKKAKIPILLIHGEDDRFVPCDMSREIYKNCSGIAQLHTFPDAGHGLCYIHDPQRYERICVDFLWGVQQLQPWLEVSEFANRIRSV